MHLELVDKIDLSAIKDETKRAFSLSIAALADGSSVRLPVNVVAGRGDRPRLAVVAGIHGDEGEGIAALMELWKDISPIDLRGRLVIVPVANPTAFAADSRCSPLDGLDLNRIFPGRADGAASEKVAFRLFEEVLSKVDFVFSMHSWSKNGEVIPYVEFDHQNSRTAKASFDAAVAAGFEIVRLSWWSPGLMTRVVNESGIPGLEAEIGGLGITTRENRGRYRRHANAIMGHLGMSAATTSARTGPRIVKHVDVFAPSGGLLTIRAEIGDDVTEGDVIARVEDSCGSVIADIHAASTGFVGAARKCASVQPGDLIFRLFSDATWEGGR